jgi:hypothetical protein
MAQFVRSFPLQAKRRTLKSTLGETAIALTGTIIGANENDIVAGGKTIILTITTGDSWVAAGGTFDAQRQNIINGLDSAQAEANGWDAVVKATLGVAAVVRTSATVVTITLTAFATYNITASETITATVPATALTLNAAVVAAPTFSVAAVSVGTTVSAQTVMMGWSTPTLFRAGSSIGASI